MPEELPPPQLHFDEAGRLMTHDGRRLSRLQSPSPLWKSLMAATEDEQAAAFVDRQYQRHLGGFWNASQCREQFEARLAMIVPYLPVARRPFTSLFPDEELSGRQKAALSRFCQDLEQYFLPRRGRGDGPIVIIHSDHGGGSRTAASALARSIRARSSREVRLFNISRLPKRRDPFREVFGIDEHRLWNHLVAEHGNIRLLESYHACIARIAEYAPSTTIGALRQEIEPLRPSLVISCLSGYVRLVMLAACGAPVVICHTDFQMNRKLVGRNPYAAFSNSYSEDLSLIELADPARFRVWIAAEDPDIQEVLSPAEKARFAHIVRVLGYPVGLPRARPLAELRQSFGLKEGERLVLFLMGLDGMGRVAESMGRAVRMLGRLAPVPCFVLIVCGRSLVSQERFGAIQGDYGKVRVRSVGPLEHDRLLEAMSLTRPADNPWPGLVVTKPGGATIAECVALGVPVLGLVEFPWERPNLEFAVRAGVAGETTAENLPRSLLQHLMQPPPIARPRLPDWENNLRIALNELI
jgi:UDP-N-acetylglucosamine:LPS N-acetylglucosamine transferase